MWEEGSKVCGFSQGRTKDSQILNRLIWGCGTLHFATIQLAGSTNPGPTSCKKLKLACLLRLRCSSKLLFKCMSLPKLTPRSSSRMVKPNQRNESWPRLTCLEGLILAHLGIQLIPKDSRSGNLLPLRYWPPGPPFGGKANLQRAALAPASAALLTASVQHADPTTLLHMFLRVALAPIHNLVARPNGLGSIPS